MLRWRVLWRAKNCFSLFFKPRLHFVPEPLRRVKQGKKVFNCVEFLLFFVMMISEP